MANNLVNRRFSGVSKLYGEHGLNRLKKAHICVIGIGGVGSWVAESLARSAIGRLTLIDLDIVSESNINRQILATEDVVGRDKVIVMKERIAQINSDCDVVTIDDFITAQNLDELLADRPDFVIDCIDDFRTKAALIAYCKTNKIKLLTTGGAGGQIDPTKIRQVDLSRTQHDVLLAKTRKLLRQDYGFPRNLKRSFSVPCVYSDEQLVFPDGNGGIQSSNGLNCAGGLGSVTHVTATFGMFCSAYVIKQLTESRAGYGS
jgi:tRNA A37 threonylcarbamoyladenosine dehydratase